ncbi:MAG: antibiotic biosynthesis monooxygenase [Pseudomonadota bacterium]
MYVTMNRFKIIPGNEEYFLDIWKNRDTFLDEVPGFKQFNLLRGPKTEEYCLFASHSVWESKQAFVDWTKSEAFRKAHANVGEIKPIYLDKPELETFETVL